MSSYIAKRDEVVVFGHGELFELLKKLAGENKLRMKVVSFCDKTDSLDTSYPIAYVGGCSEEELYALKCAGVRLVNWSHEYQDRLIAEKLSYPSESFTRYVKVKKGMYYPVIKRMIDFILALVGIIVSSPIMLVTAILVRSKLGSPIVFSQVRPGKYEKNFKVYKFRSMTNACDENGELLPDEKRMTRFGAILRSTSLDELPQLFSILKGHMSLIGPRPQSFENVYFMNPTQRMRHCVTPGLTGHSQVNGRNAIPWDEKIQFDLDYIEKGISFWKDLKIFFKTVKIVLMRKDITQSGSVSTESVGEFLVRTGKLNDLQFHKLHEESHCWIRDFD